MPIQFYILPVQRVTDAGGVHRGPMYLKWRMNPDGLDVLWSLKDYGTIDLGCVATDMTADQHAWLVAQANVYQFPEALDVTMTSGQRSTLSTYLEVHNVSGDWLAPGNTFRVACRTITNMFFFMQRLTNKAGTSPFDWGVDLNTQWRDLTTQQQGWITETFVSFNFDYFFIRSTTTMRVIIKNAADQFGARPINFGLVTL